MSPITQNQWKSIGKVVLYIVGSAAIAVLVAYITGNPALVVLQPLVNILAVTVAKLLTSNEKDAISTLPSDLQAPVQQVVDTVTTTATNAAVDAVNNITK